MIRGVVAADPDVAFGVDVDTVLVAGPVVALSRPAPGGKEVALLVELEHGGGGDTAIRALRVERRAALVFGQRARALQDPDVVIRVDCNTGGLADDPVIGQGLGPVGIDGVARPARWSLDALGEGCPAGEQRRDARERRE